MQKIKQLPAHEAHKIAAGEVVERPANVVKELIENALDAGASRVDVYIEDAGKKLIRVVDNGCGMSPEDAHMAFVHHATSKITQVQDLDTLQTFGFRGEALSSIASVSTVTLITKEEHVQEGTKLTLIEGMVSSQEIVSAVTGTDIRIAAIFSNVPARKKFLKSRDTEWRQIVQLFQATTISHKNIHFTLHHDGTLVYQCPPTADLQMRVSQIWPDLSVKSLLEVRATGSNPASPVSVSGVISDHQVTRYNRNHIFLFVNNRWIKNHHISRAVMRGYANVLPHDKYPVACLFITVVPNQVDVNIHPRKDEVRFLNPRIVEILLQDGIKRSLELRLSQRLAPAFSGARAQTLDAYDVAAINMVQQLSDSSYKPLHRPVYQNSEYKQHVTHSQVLTPVSIEHQASVQSLEQNRPHDADYVFLAQFKKTYILIEKSEGLFIIDQHAAHERILYERFIHRAQNIETVQLLFPHTITVSHDDMSILIPYLEYVQGYGIGIEQCGPDQLVVKSTPVYIKNVRIDDIIAHIIELITQNQQLEHADLMKILNHAICAQMACKAAVKAGDELSEQHIHQLLADLAQCPNRFSCPHGRPTSWMFEVSEIEKKFKRRL